MLCVEFKLGNKPLRLCLVPALLWAVVAGAEGQTTHRIAGCVHGQNGTVIENAAVLFIPNDKSAAETGAKTDGTGQFDLGTVSFKSGKVEITAAGFVRSEFIWNALTSPPRLDIVLMLSPISERVTITQNQSRIEETPESVVLISQKDLESTAAQAVDDKLKQIPGFTLFRRTGSRTANPTTQGISLRGTGPSGASRALVLLDGVPLNDPFGGWIYWGRIPSEAIAQVEVLRGPAGDLYGSAAVGGVVTVNTKRASAEPATDLDVSYGNQQTPSVSAYTSAGVGKWYGSLASEGFTTDGFIALDDKARGLADARSDSRRLVVTPTVERRFGAHDRVYISGGYYDERRNNGTPLQNNDTRIQNLTAGNDNETERYGLISVRVFADSQIYHQSFSSVAADRNSETLTRLQTVPAQSVGFRGQWSLTVREKYAFLAGTDLREVRGRSDETGFGGGRAASLSTAGGREFTFGGFVGAVIPIGSRLSISGGLRYDRWRNYAAYSATKVLLSGQVSKTIFPIRSEDAVSPRVSILFRAARHISLTGSFATGFRQPTLNELYRSFRVGNVMTLANENLRAERAVNGEAGLIVSSFSGRLYSRSNVFCNEISRPAANVTLSTTPTLITRQRQNLGRTRACGMEIDTQIRLAPDISISAGYLFVDARVASFPADITLEDLKVPQVAKQQFTSQIRYSNPRIANVGIQFRSASSQFDDDQNQFRLAGFFTVDAFASRTIYNGLGVYAAVENLFNSRVEAARTPLLSLASPRTFRVGLRVHLR
jgi:Outer membrane receptor for ferrienterochelin and colicins